MLYPQTKSEALHTEELGWCQHIDSTSSAFDFGLDMDFTRSDWGGPVHCRDYVPSEWSSLDAFSDYDSLSPVQLSPPPETDGRLYGANIECEPWNSLRSTYLIQANQDQGRSDSAGPFGRPWQPRNRVFEDASPWADANDTFEILNYASGTPYLDFEYDGQLSSMNGSTNNIDCGSYDRVAADVEPSSQTVCEPGLGFHDDVDPKLSCYYINCDKCGKPFVNATDCKRHFNTFHNVERQSYRCAHNGCVRVYKVWNRLDSFKQHARRHNLDESQIQALVQRSRNREHNSLHVALTTKTGLSKIRPNDLEKHLARSHILLSDETNHIRSHV